MGRMYFRLSSLHLSSRGFTRQAAYSLPSQSSMTYRLSRWLLPEKKRYPSFVYSQYPALYAAFPLYISFPLSHW